MDNHAAWQNTAVNSLHGSALGSAQPPAPPNFADALRSAEEDVVGLADRVMSLQIKLVGLVPTPDKPGEAVSVPEGVLPTAYRSAARIAGAVRRMHESLDRIDSALPGA